MSQASVCHHDLFPRFTILNKKVLQRPTTTFCIIWRKKKKKNLTRVSVNDLVCVTVSHPRKEKLQETFYEHFAPMDTTVEINNTKERSGGM